MSGRTALLVAAAIAALLACRASTAGVPSAVTILEPSPLEHFDGPSATVPIDFHADCSSTGTKYVVADAFNEDGKQVASSGTVFALDHPLTLTVTIDNGFWTEEFTVEVTLHCGKDIVPGGQTELTVTDGKALAEAAVLYWEGRVRALKAGVDALDDDGMERARAALAVGLDAADEMRMDFAQIAHDPPDASFTTVETAHPGTAPRFSGAGTAALNRLDAELARLDGLAKALTVSIDRAAGARRAHHKAALHAQVVAAASYASQLETGMKALPSLVQAAMRDVRNARSGPAASIARHNALAPLASTAFAKTLAASTAALAVLAGSHH